MEFVSVGGNSGKQEGIGMFGYGNRCGGKRVGRSKGRRRALYYLHGRTRTLFA